MGVARMARAPSGRECGCQGTQICIRRETEISRTHPMPSAPAPEIPGIGLGMKVGVVTELGMEPGTAGERRLGLEWRRRQAQVRDSDNLTFLLWTPRQVCMEGHVRGYTMFK